MKYFFQVTDFATNTLFRSYHKEPLHIFRIQHIILGSRALYFNANVSGNHKVQFEYILLNHKCNQFWNTFYVVMFSIHVALRLSAL